MKTNKTYLSALFLISSTALYYSQESKKDTLKKEKKIEGVIIKGNTSKSNENNLINLQKKSVEVVERVGSVQLEKQGVGDVATAVTKATGTQKQEGSNELFVRGLGDRYNATTLNGLPIPSDNPENKNLNLGIFKTSMVEYISLEKVYSPRISGDFGGANINIVSKEYTGRPYFKVGIGSSINFQSIKQNHFKVQDGAPGFFGYRVSTFNKNVNPFQTYPFLTKWNFKDANNPFNSNLSLEMGKTFTFKNGKKLSIFSYGGFDNDYLYSDGKEGFYDSTGGVIKDLYSIKKYDYNTNTTGLLNMGFQFNANNKITFTSNYIHSSSQSIRLVNGQLREVGNYDNVLIRKTDNKITDTWINQVFGTHKINDSWTANWALAYNDLGSKRPDVLQNTIDIQDPNTPFFLSGSAILNSRYFDELKDKNAIAHAELTKIWKNFKFNFGYDGNFKKRNFNYHIIGLEFNQNPSNLDPENIDGFINANNNGFLGYVTLQGYGHQIFDPFYYDFSQNLNSGYVNIDVQFNEKLTAQFGGRLDQINIKNNWYSAEFGMDKSKKNYHKILPALNVKYAINDRINLRIAASKTYTLPQAKELVPVSYYDLTNNTYGNPYLYPSDNYNGDLKFEFFPHKGELFSVTGFSKYIKNPIAKSTFASASSSDMTYFNIADYGTVFGAEIEVRKNIIEKGNTKIYAFANGTFMNTKQKLNPEKVSTENKKSIEFSGQTFEKLQGAAEFIANANIGYTTKWSGKNNLDVVISYAYTGKVLYAIGTNNTGNFYQQPINSLDANVKFTFDKIGVGIFGKNLINPNSTINQVNNAGVFVYRNYKKGQEMGINLSYKF